MKNMVQNPKVIAGTVTFLLAIALVSLISFYEANRSLEAGLNDEKLKSERILSEKLSLEKEIAKLKQSVTSLQGRNAELDKTLTSTSAKIAEKERELSRMSKENASLKQYKQQYADIQKIKNDLESQVLALNNALTAANKEKESLNRMVAELQVKNKSLSDELAQIQIASLDDIRVEAFKKNKLTVSAKKTKKLDINFIIPSKYSADNLTFKISDPSGQVLSPKDGTIAYVETQDAPILTADASDMLYLKQTKQVKMEYKPKKKLKAGIYRIEVSSADNAYLGSLQVRLR